MLVAQGSIPLRPPLGRAARYDTAILDAAVIIADQEGWRSMTFSHVAEAAGVSRQAVLSRHASRSALAASVWSDRLATTVDRALEVVVAACPRPGNPVDSDDLTNALSAFTAPGEPMRAAAELLLVARYDPRVNAAVHETLGPALERWIVPNRGAVTRVQAARRGFLIALALGLLLEARREQGGRVELAGALDRVGAALEQPAAPARLPLARATHLDEPADFDVGDQTWATVLQATLDEVGTHGYEAATMNDIARASGHTQGAIFSRYATKLELFLDATARMLTNAGRKGAEYQAGIAANRSVGIADAAMIREIMRPGRASVRTITLEQCRLSWHDPNMLAVFETALSDPAILAQAAYPGSTPDQARGWLHVEFGRGLGSAVLADLHPQAWDLPYDVVLVPLNDGPAS